MVHPLQVDAHVERRWQLQIVGHVAAGEAWDYKADSTPKMAVEPTQRAGIYESDMRAAVDAYEHGIVFTKADIDHFIATATARNTARRSRRCTQNGRGIGRSGPV